MVYVLTDLQLLLLGSENLSPDEISLSTSDSLSSAARSEYLFDDDGLDDEIMEVDVQRMFLVDETIDPNYTPLLDRHQPWAYAYGVKEEIVEDEEAEEIDFDKFLVENFDENKPATEFLDQKLPAKKSAVLHTDVTDTSSIAIVSAEESAQMYFEFDLFSPNNFFKRKRALFDEEENPDLKSRSPRKRRSFRARSDN